MFIYMTFFKSPSGGFRGLSRSGYKSAEGGRDKYFFLHYNLYSEVIVTIISDYPRQIKTGLFYFNAEFFYF
jgi:hypothetical protein